MRTFVEPLGFQAPHGTVGTTCNTNSSLLPPGGVDRTAPRLETMTMSASGYEPKPLLFNDETDVPSAPVETSPTHDSTMPKPLVFTDETPVREAKGITSVGPRALTFPEASPTTTKPAVVLVEAGTRSLFASTESPLIAQALPLAEKTYPALWALDNGSTFLRHFRHLLPVTRTTIDGWGEAAMDRVTQLALSTARLTRRYIDLNGTELLQRTLEDARAPTPPIWQRFIKPAVNLDECRLRLTNLRRELPSLIHQSNEQRKQAQSDEQRLAHSLASLTVVVTLNARSASNEFTRALDDRRSLITNSLHQASLLNPQLKTLSEQMEEMIRQLDEALRVTLPALELARAGRS